MFKKKEKVLFDVKNQDHRKIFHGFVKNGNKWGNNGCPFKHTFPWESVVAQAYQQIALFCLENELTKKELIL